MDQWEEEKPSSEVEASILSRVREGLHREAKKNRRNLWINLAETVLPLLAATAMAFLGVSLAVKKIGPSLQSFSPLLLLTCGVVWVAIYNIIFFLSTQRLGGGYRIKHVQLNLFARYALVALGVWIFLNWLTELSGFEEFAAGLLDKATPVGRYFVLGAFYSFIPLTSLAIIIKRGGLGNAPLHGVLIGFFFLLLLSPEVFLYCGSFSVGIAVSWSLGILMGCATGGPFAIWLGQKALRGLPA
ncbi:MAG: hypothetical protein ACE5JU_22400 [Candidatus Binatia bacterium]